MAQNPHGGPGDWWTRVSNLEHRVDMLTDLIESTLVQRADQSDAQSATLRAAVQEVNNLDRLHDPTADIE